MSIGLALATRDGVVYKTMQGLEEQHIAEPYSLESSAQAAATRMHPRSVACFGAKPGSPEANTGAAQLSRHVEGKRQARTPKCFI